MENGFNNNKSILSACKTVNFKSWYPLREKPLSSGCFDQKSLNREICISCVVPITSYECLYPYNVFIVDFCYCKAKKIVVNSSY